jgi:asparagine synthase (glutamine-hydrolysing)
MPLDMKLRNGNTKYALKKILDRYLPDELIQRPKRGFSIPVFRWFSSELDEKFETYLSDEMLKKVDILDVDEVKKEYRKYLYYKRLGKSYNIEKMWRLLSFMMWWEKYANNAR